MNEPLRQLGHDLKDFKADQEDKWLKIGWAVVYASIILSICVLAMLYAGIEESPAPDHWSPNHSAQQGINSASGTLTTARPPRDEFEGLVDAEPTKLEPGMDRWSQNHSAQ